MIRSWFAQKVRSFHHVFDSFSLLFPFLCSRVNCSLRSSLGHSLEESKSPFWFLRFHTQKWAIRMKNQRVISQPCFTFPLLLLFLILTIPYLFPVLDVQYLVYPSLHFLHVVVIFLSILFHNFFDIFCPSFTTAVHFLHVIVIFIYIIP